MSDPDDHQSPPPRFCAVCGYALLANSRGDYFHAAVGHADHLVVPVPREELPAPMTHCDFCYGTPTPWLVESETFRSAHGDILRGNWACCEGCVPYVRARRWTALVGHVLEVRPGLAPKWYLRDMYQRLAAHLGEVLPMDQARLHDHN